MRKLNKTPTVVAHVLRCRSRRAAFLALALFGAGAAGALPGTGIVAATAYAGEWVQVSCANPDQSAAPSEGWSSFITGAQGFGSNNSTNCTPTSPMFALLSTAAVAAVGTSENLAYTPPAGSTLAGGDIDVSLYADGYGIGASGTAVLYSPVGAYDASNVFFQCANGQAPCPSDEYSGVLALPANRGGGLYLAAGCGGIAGQACNSGGSLGAWSLVQLSWAHLLLTNTAAPAANGFSGSLLSPDAHGTADIAFTATDANGPGVYNVTVQIDGNPVYNATPNTNQGKCATVGTDTTTGALMFDWQQPCLQTETVDIPVDTTTLTDGEHQLKVIVTDAAQNSSTVLDQTITTLNTPTSPPPPPPPPATATPVYSLALDTATKRLTRGVRRPYSHSALGFAGTLENAAAVAAPGIPVAVWAQAASGGGFSEVAQTTTDAAGAWTLTAPPGSSRLLRIVAGTNTPAAGPTSSISVHETVIPELSLHVTTPGAGRIVFTGRLRVTPLGRPRPLVFIQTHGPQGWEVVGTPIRVDSRGQYRYTYHSSPLTLDRGFTFRAITPQTTLWQRGRSQVRSAEVH